MSEQFLLKELKSRGLSTQLIQDMTALADETIRGLQSNLFLTGIFVYASHRKLVQYMMVLLEMLYA